MQPAGRRQGPLGEGSSRARRVRELQHLGRGIEAHGVGADYHAGATAKALAEFPLSRVTEDFYDQMLNVLPPVHRRGCPGFFVSEALTLNVHAQFISHNGRYYGGNADLSTGGRTWSIDDVDALEASLDPATPPLSWYP